MLKNVNKKILCSLIMISFLFAIQSQVLVSAASDDWPMFHHDLTHTGYSSNTPTTVTSTLLWNFTTNIPVSASPTIVDGKVYVGSLGGIAYCLNAVDGSIIWNYTVQARTQGRYGAGAPAIGSSIAFAGGYVYFGSYDRNVYCLNAETGDKVWNYTTGNTVESSPSISNGYVYVGSWDGNVYCLDALTGSKIWNYTTGSQVESSPAIAEGKVYVGSVDNNVYCLDALTGDKIWSYKTWNLVQSSPAVVDGRVYIGSEDMNLYCLDATTGAEKWIYTTQAHVNSSPSIVNGNVYVASWDHTIYAFGTQSTTTRPSSFSVSSESTLLMGIAVSVLVIIAAILVRRRRKHV